MSEPDLSFLDPAGRQPAAAEHMPRPPASSSSPSRTPGASAEGLVADLRAYQAELENQNKVLRYSQAVAESAYERFETLFASVPLALMVVDDHDMVVQACRATGRGVHWQPCGLPDSHEPPRPVPDVSRRGACLVPP